MCIDMSAESYPTTLIGVDSLPCAREEQTALDSLSQIPLLMADRPPIQKTTFERPCADFSQSLDAGVDRPFILYKSKEVQRREA